VSVINQLCYNIVKADLYSVSDICSIDIWNATRQITDNVAFFLPKNANIDQVLTACLTVSVLLYSYSS